MKKFLYALGAIFAVAFTLSKRGRIYSPAPLTERRRWMLP